MTTSKNTHSVKPDEPAPRESYNVEKYAFRQKPRTPDASYEPPAVMVGNRDAGKKSKKKTPYADTRINQSYVPTRAQYRN